MKLVIHSVEVVGLDYKFMFAQLYLLTFHNIEVSESLFIIL